MLFISIIIIILLVHFLIIRPITSRNRSQMFEPRRRGYFDQKDYYGPIHGGMGRFGSFTGGIATGALLTYLFENGRIGFDQFNAMQNLEDYEIMRQLMDQNILQEHEINQLQDDLGNNNENDQTNWTSDNVDEDYTYDDQQDFNDDGNWSNSDNGWDNSDNDWV